VTRILRPHARFCKIPQRLHQEDDVLEGDSRVGIVPEPRIGPRAHEHQHVSRGRGILRPRMSTLPARISSADAAKSVSRPESP